MEVAIGEDEVAMGAGTTTGEQRGPRRGSARAKILTAAGRRFYRDGIGATGIDTITADAGVAKMSLYNNFRSKAELIEAYLEQRHHEQLELHRRRHQALAAGAGPQLRVLAVFDAYLDHAEHTSTEQSFRGCGLLNAAAELATDDPARAAIARHKAEIEDLFLAALSPTATDDQDTQPADDQQRALAEHLSFLLEGATVRAGLEGNLDPMRRARELAATLVEHRPGTGR